MLLFFWLGFLASVNALPTPQFLESAATLTSIPSPNHILILTPQAQVQLEPSLKYSKQIIQNLVPIARINNPNDQTVVYIPSESLIKTTPISDQRLKQIENVNFTTIVSQAVNAANTAQANLESLQQQLSQGLEGLVQPTGGQKIEETSAAVGIQPINPALAMDLMKETARLDNGHLYSLPNIPQFYSNVEVIHSPISPLFAVQPFQTIRARSLVHTENKIALTTPSMIKDQNLNILKISDANQKQDIQLKSTGAESHERNIDLSLDSKLPDSKKHKLEKEIQQKQSSEHFEKFLGSVEKSSGLSIDQPELKNTDDKSNPLKEKERKESISFAESLPTGLAISGEGGLSQSKPVGSAIVGKDGVAYSAPSGTAISGSSNNEKSSTSL